MASGWGGSGWGQAEEQGGLLHPSGMKRPGRQQQSTESPRRGPNLLQLRLCSAPICPTECFVPFPQPRAEFSPPLFRIHENSIPPKPSTDRVDFNFASNWENNYDRTKKWILAVYFSRLFLMRFWSALRDCHTAFLVARNWADGWRRHGSGNISQALGCSHCPFVTRARDILAARTHLPPECSWNKCPSDIWGWHFIHSPPIY